jgi:hypothetical protein
MNNPSMILKSTCLVLGLIITIILVCNPAGAGEAGMTFPITQSGFYASSHLSNNYSGGLSPSDGARLTIPVAGLLSLDLSLSSVDKGQILTGPKPFGAPPIPVAKPGPYRFGALFNFRF